MTQHLKCDNSVVLKNFCAKFVCLFSRVVTINVLFLSEITLRIRNWHEVKLEVQILQLHIVIYYVMLYVPTNYFQIY